MREKTTILIWAAAAVALTLSMVLYPKDGLEAAKEGMNLFLNVVFPSLLPFFVLSDIMLGLGVVHFIGVLFTPLMRPVFNTPGEGAFVLSMGLAAGYPMDAVITSRFRKQGLCTRIEAERMLAYSNTADPLFIWGAVAVGMFGMPALGGTMALAHYSAALLVGLSFRFYGRRDTERTPEPNRQGNILGRAIDALVKARAEDGRPFGQMLGDAVNDSIKTLLMICGFIMLFSTMVKIIDVVGLYGVIAAPIEWLYRAIGIDLSLVRATVSGLLEIDLGALAASKATQAPLIQAVAVAGAIIAWSGLSVHGQVASVLTGTDIRMTPYWIARFLHAVLAFIFTLIFMPSPGSTSWFPQIVPVLGGLPASMVRLGFWEALARGVSWSVAIPLGLALVGAVAAATTGGFRWISFQYRR